MAKITEVKGWTLNSEVPTGKTTEIKWNGKKIPTSIKEFNFLRLGALHQAVQVRQLLSTIQASLEHGNN